MNEVAIVDAVLDDDNVLLEVPPDILEEVLCDELLVVADVPLVLLNVLLLLCSVVSKRS